MSARTFFFPSLLNFDMWMTSCVENIFALWVLSRQPAHRAWPAFPRQNDFDFILHYNAHVLHTTRVAEVHGCPVPLITIGARRVLSIVYVNELAQKKVWRGHGRAILEMCLLSKYWNTEKNALNFASIFGDNKMQHLEHNGVTQSVWKSRSTTKGGFNKRPWWRR